MNKNEALVTVGNYINISNLDVIPRLDATIVLSESSDLSDKRMYEIGESLVDILTHMTQNGYAKDRIKAWLEENVPELFCGEEFADVIDVFVK